MNVGCRLMLVFLVLTLIKTRPPGRIFIKWCIREKRDFAGKNSTCQITISWTKYDNGMFCQLSCCWIVIFPFFAHYECFHRYKYLKLHVVNLFQEHKKHYFHLITHIYCKLQELKCFDVINRYKRRYVCPILSINSNYIGMTLSR